MLPHVAEGAAALAVPAGVFFNAKQRLQRDLSLLAVHEYVATAGQDVALLDALAGSGVRALRYLLEVPQVRTVVANDVSREAVAAIRASAQRSGLDRGLAAPCGSRLEVRSRDAAELMEALRGRFDVVDLDPCGSVAALLPAAIACLRDGGMLMASCTDLGSLSGRFGDAAARYGATPLPLPAASKQAPELAMRALLGCVARAASAAGRRIRPRLSVAFADFFVRVVLTVHDETGGGGGGGGGGGSGSGSVLQQCTGCGTLQAQHGDAGARCEHCGGRSFSIGGPFWLGPTGDAETLRGMARRLDAAAEEEAVATEGVGDSGGSDSARCRCGSHAVLRPLLESLLAEVCLPRAVLPVPVPPLCRMLRCAPIPMPTLLAALKAMGCEAVVSHWSPVTIKVALLDGARSVWDALAAWAPLHPLSRVGDDEGAADVETAGEAGDAEAGDGRGDLRARLLERRGPASAAAADLFREATASSLQLQKRRRLEPAATADGAEVAHAAAASSSAAAEATAEAVPPPAPGAHSRERGSRPMAAGVGEGGGKGGGGDGGGGKGGGG